METWIILANGFLKVAIWTVGIGFTYWRRRGLLCAGFAGAAYTATVRALDDAANPPTAEVTAATLVGTLVAAAIVGSFIFTQDRRGGRPVHWTP